MSYENILYSMTDGIAEIRFNRPHRLNAVTAKFYEEFNEALFKRVGGIQQGVEARRAADRFIHKASLRVDSPPAADMQCTSDTK